MPDLENVLYDAIRTYVDGKKSGLNWSTVPEPVPASFPTIFVELRDNPVDKNHIYDAIGEHTLPCLVIKAVVKDQDKALAKELLGLCDEYLASIGMIRSFGPANDNNPDAFTMYSIYDENIVRISDGRIFSR